MADERTFRSSDLEVILQELAIGANARLILSTPRAGEARSRLEEIDSAMAHGVLHAVERLSYRFNLEVPKVSPWGDDQK